MSWFFFALTLHIYSQEFYRFVSWDPSCSRGPLPRRRNQRMIKKSKRFGVTPEKHPQNYLNLFCDSSLYSFTERPVYCLKNLLKCAGSSKFN